MEFTEVIARRRSVRHFGPEPIPRDVVQGLIDEATLAPSAGNRQPWQIAALAPAAARRLCDAVEPKAWEILYPTLREVIAKDPSVLGSKAPSGRRLTELTMDFVAKEIFLRGNFWLLVVHFHKRSAREVAANLTSAAAFFRHRVGVERTLRARLDLATLLAARSGRALECDFLADVGSVAGFMYGLTLSAANRNLASCIQYTYGLVQPEVRKHLGLDGHAEVLGAVVIGQPGDGSAHDARRALRRPAPITWHEE